MSSDKRMEVCYQHNVCQTAFLMEHFRTAAEVAGGLHFQHQMSVSYPNQFYE